MPYNATVPIIADTNRPRPIVRFFAVCVDAELNAPPSGDLASGWWELRNVLHTASMPPGVTENFGVEELFVYLQLSGGVGEYTVQIAVVEADLYDPDQSRLVRRSDSITVTFPDTWDVVEETVQLLRVPFPRPGQYQFRLMENGQQLEGGSTFLRVLSGDQP